MNIPLRFSYSSTTARQTRPGLLAYLPLTLTHEVKKLTISGLLDTGSTVNVLPYAIGLELGLLWEEQDVSVALTGSLARIPAKGVVISGQVGSFDPINLVFAWTQAQDVPMILGQMNFFMEYDVCFLRSQSLFEIKPKSG